MDCRTLNTYKNLSLLSPRMPSTILSLPRPRLPQPQKTIICPCHFLRNLPVHQPPGSCSSTGMWRSLHRCVSHSRIGQPGNERRVRFVLNTFVQTPFKRQKKKRRTEERILVLFFFFALRVSLLVSWQHSEQQSRGVPHNYRANGQEFCSLQTCFKN
jgi:hypothetical protein